MFARFLMFGLCLLAGWLIWRTLRQWMAMNSVQRGATGGRRDATLRLDHRRADGSASGWMAASASGEVISGKVRGGEGHSDPLRVGGHDSPLDASSKGVSSDAVGDSCGDSCGSDGSSSG